MTLSKPRNRTLSTDTAYISVVLPAHNEESTIKAAVAAAKAGLDELGLDGEVIVSASGCTDKTADFAEEAGATVIVAPKGKGEAILSGVKSARGDIVCLMDADLEYYGETPLIALLVEPIVRGIADATISNLYWRPMYPDQWLNGFFAPLAGLLLPEILPKVGSTPWSGQRAARRNLWPDSLPAGFTSDLAITLHWNQYATQLRPVLTDDWFNPIRPKPELLAQDFRLLVDHAIGRGRIASSMAPRLDSWFAHMEPIINGYDEAHPDPMGYERNLLETAQRELQRRVLQPVDQTPDVG